MSNYSIPLKKLAEEFNLSVAWQSTDYEHIEVTVDEVSRPGLPLVGFFEHFEARRLEVLGLVEMTYLDRRGAQRILRPPVCLSHPGAGDLPGAAAPPGVSGNGESP